MIGTAKERHAALEALYPTWQPLTLWERLEKNCALFAKRPYVIFEDCTYTFEETLLETERTARALLALGVRHGDHVAIVSHNRPEFIFLIYALSRIGAVEVPINVGIQREELDFVLTQSDTDWLFTERHLSALPAAVKASIFFDYDRPAADGETAYSTFVQAGEGLPPEVWAQAITHRIPPEEMCGIMYTSGSTSRPKGVILTADMLQRSAYSTCLCRCMEIGRRIFVPIPLFHAFAMVEGMLAALFCGGSVVMTRQRFEVGHALEMMKRFEVNDIICVSVIMHNLLTKGPQLNPADYPHMHAAYWASTCADWIWDAGRKAFGIDDVTTSYGMTECGSTTVMLTPDDPHDCPTWCHGRQKIAGNAALPDANGHQFYMKVTNPDTGAQITTPETAGELCCKGPTVTPGYYNNPDATQKAFDKDGWFHTGDLVKFNGDGYVTFLGRINDMYKINGENVSPKFIDSILGGAPVVKEVETVGVYHPKYGEISVAFVELTEDTPLNRCSVRKYGCEHLANFQRPRYYCFSPQTLWPHTSSDKVSKVRLRKAAESWFAENTPQEDVYEVNIF